MALSNLLFDRQAVVDRVIVRDTTLEVRQLANGTWAVQGSPIDQLLPRRERPAEAGGGLGPIELRLQDIAVNLLQPGDERPKTFQIPLLIVNRDDVRMAIDANVELPEALGDALEHDGAGELLAGDALYVDNEKVTKQLQEGLITEDGKVVYAVEDKITILLEE